MNISIKLCFAILLGILGCSDVENNNYEKIEFENPFDYFGVYHNKMLEEIHVEYGSLVGSKATKGEHFSFGRELVYQKADEHQIDVSKINHFINDVFDSQKSNKLFRSKSINGDLKSFFANLDLSDKAKGFLFKIAELSDSIASYQMNHDKLNIRLSKLNSDAYNSLSKSESEIVLKTSSVFYHSSLYWKENLDKWIELLRKTHLGNESKKLVNTNLIVFEWQDFYGADIEGLFVGMVFGIPGGGGGVAAGAVLGSLAGSLGYAIGVLLDWISS